VYTWVVLYFLSSEKKKKNVNDERRRDSVSSVCRKTCRLLASIWPFGEGGGLRWMTVVNIQTRMDRLVSRRLLPMREVSGMMETLAAGLSRMGEGEGCSDLVSVESFEERLRQVRGGGR